MKYGILVLSACILLTSCSSNARQDGTGFPSLPGTLQQNTQASDSTEASSESSAAADSTGSTEHSEETGTTEGSQASAPNLIGLYYTREELEALDNAHNGWGAGSSEGGVRPPYALSTQPRYEKYDAWFIAPENGKVYLTYDLGYEHKDLTNETLDILKEKNVKAVFFVNMEYISDNHQIILRIIEEGHTLANHAYHHYDMTELSIDEMISEIMDLHNYVLKTYDYEMTLFRPPSGYYSERLLAVAHTLGYTTVQYSFSYRDWETDNQPPVDEARAKLIDRAHSGAIYLLHTVSETNTAVLSDVIDGIREKGYSIELFDPNKL